MKITNTLLKIFLPALFLFNAIYVASGNTPESDSLNFSTIYEDLSFSLAQEQKYFFEERSTLLAKLEAVNHLIANTAGRKKKKYRKALEEKLRLINMLEENEALLDGNMLKVRYRKGVDLIKIMYEKILGLDHHFTGMQTYQNVSMLCNPHTYPEFVTAKEHFQKKTTKKFSMKLPSLLETNPFISASFTLISAFLGNRSSQSKKADVEKIACILDFTVRMNADLNVVRHETEFLKQANQNMKDECGKLFEEYTKVIGYHTPLEKCRGNDDWESLFDKLEVFITELEQQKREDPNGGINKNEVNMEFATQRVADFIGKYSTFVAQGTQYYQKFDNIVSTYKNEQACQDQLPRQFSELKFDIKSTIEKFNNTYNLPEIQGSRLKDLLYGISQGY